MSAELEARRTAGAAVLADFRHELATAPLSRPPGREWMFRLADVLGSLLEVEPDAPDEDDLADGTEPYCTTCGAWVGMFIGLDGWHHYRGDPAPGGKRDLYDAEHPAVVGWTRPQVLTPGEVTTIIAGLQDASEGIRERAAWSPTCLCEECAARLTRADEYDALADTLRSDR